MILDEYSMVKSEQMYQIHRRLQETKQSKEPFGGIAVILFGDLKQLKPVLGSWIFDAPSDSQDALSHSVKPLWDHFQPMFLRKNHRQGN